MDSSFSEPTPKSSKIYLAKCMKDLLDSLSEMEDLVERLALVNRTKLLLKREAALLQKLKLEPFSMVMELLTNAIISINEEKEGVLKEMKKFTTPVTCANIAKGKGIAKEGTLQGGCFASGSNPEGNSSSMFQYLQKAQTQATPYVHEGRALKEMIASPLPPLAFREKGTLPISREPSSAAAARHPTGEVTRDSRKRKLEFEEPINEARERHGVCMQLDQERRLFIAPFREQPQATCAVCKSFIVGPASAIASSSAQFGPTPNPLDEVDRLHGRY
ncbi:hypothetical protein OSB04_000046 [Centaurea solstitialis]|uniref:Uncharacterized protein n=1 Tax=Centaurea solstitialis TaxID=347529 RepID=A0AA38WRW1_9ASTR|nr:hypothetical protein OSB04_000046 [Centaurea solstitialis]